MDINKTIDEICDENGYEDIMVFRDFDYADALIGITNDGIAVYSFNKMVEWLKLKQNWSEEDAIDWIEYNTINAYFGGNTPIIVYDRMS